MSSSRIKSIVGLLMLLLPIAVVSQEESILSGKINTVDSINSPVHIINVTKRNGNTSELSGYFSISVSVGDVLLFSSIQFEKKEIEITAEILKNNILEVNLIPVINELDEVRVHNLSGDLSKDVAAIKTYDPTALGYTFSDRIPLTIEERKLSALNSNPIGLIYGAISGENKMLKKAIANNKLRKLVNKAKDQLPNEFYLEDIRLPENKIMDFLYYCSLKPNFKEMVNKNDPLVLIEFLEGMITEYNEFVEK